MRDHLQLIIACVVIQPPVFLTMTTMMIAMTVTTTQPRIAIICSRAAACTLFLRSVLYPAQQV